MHAAGRYLGCSLAKTPYCYFQDHPGPRHWRSLYANFLRFPNLIHTESRDVEAYARAKWRWCFFNDGKKKHKIFSRGSVFCYMGNNLRG